MAVVERAVAAMDAHQREVDVVKSGLVFLRNMSCVNNKVGCVGQDVAGRIEEVVCDVLKLGNHEASDWASEVGRGCVVRI
jgi:hypothetical protein